MATPQNTHLDSLPAWARELSEKYYSRTLTMFVLYGNVRDLAPLKRGDTVEFIPLQKFLIRTFDLAPGSPSWEHSCHASLRPPSFVVANDSFQVIL